MIDNLFFQIFNLLINLIDHSNKNKILNFLKSKLRNKPLNIIDIGAHKGETINFFSNNFMIKKIHAFEPNIDLFYALKQKKKYQKQNINIYNSGVGQKDERKPLNIMNDSSSSTFNSINENTKYFKKKKKNIIYFFSK